MTNAFQSTAIITMNSSLLNSIFVSSGKPLLAVKPRTINRLNRQNRAIKAVAEPAPAPVPFLSDAQHLEKWGPQSWRNFVALQQPEYPSEVSINC